ncbi:MAG: 4'-phosphopantetheinyl transferase superfamily protein [Holosporaceae bacterium]|jgi:phosphopantetheinyl transferase|nr:4'-phosphopantetheinyl transferase superfamily protein [Holosporaceae bacterium]
MVNVVDIPFFYEGKKEKCALAIAFAEEAKNFYELLSIDELDKLSSIKLEKIRKQYCLGRILTKKALSSFVGDFAFNNVSVLNEESGCPIIKCSDYATSITHTNETVASLVFKRKFSFGIDIESLREKARNALRSIIVDEESIPDDLENITIAWTLKESLSKALKTGFRLPFSELELSFFSQKENVFTCSYKKHPEFSGIAIFHNNKSFALTYPSEAVCVEDSLRAYEVNLLFSKTPGMAPAS